MRTRDIFQAEEISTDWGDMLMDYRGLIEAIVEIEGIILGQVYIGTAANQDELVLETVQKRITRILDSEATG